jgi:hypothetical protein
MKALAVKAEDRFQTVAQFQNAMTVKEEPPWQTYWERIAVAFVIVIVALLACGCG